MKKIILIILTVSLNIGLFSCSPEVNTEDNNPELIEEPQQCCGDDGEISPPPPSTD